MKNWLITLLTTLLICNSDFWIAKPPVLYIGVFVLVAIIVWEIDLQVDRMKWRKRECGR
jgi:hypothetical protein